MLDTYMYAAGYIQRFRGRHIDLFPHCTSGLLDKAFYMQSHWSMRCSHNKYKDLCNCHSVFHDKNFQHYLHQKISVYQKNENVQSNTINTADS